ncbi:MAG: M28 family peptidase [Planctomycetaceae bacterium]
MNREAHRRFADIARTALLVLLCCGCSQDAEVAAGPQPGAVALKRDLIPFDAQRAFGYLEQVCAIGPRISGTDGMLQQQRLLETHFVALGAQVFFQEFDTSHPETGGPVRMRNLIVSWHPEQQDRVLLCCHYDTRPRPDRESQPINRDKPFLGANDGGSGVALLMELGHHMPAVQPSLGVDFVFFDGEELVYDNVRDQERYFLGSKYFAEQYRDRPPGFRYRCGVLLDMVGGKDFKAYYESNSLRFAPELTQSVWASAREVKVKEFVARRKHEVRDDHLPLNQIARIPTCDIIDFDYPYWHMRNDIPAACSGDTLAKVARVLMHWLRNVPEVPPVRNVR